MLVCLTYHTVYLALKVHNPTLDKAGFSVNMSSKAKGPDRMLDNLEQQIKTLKPKF